jgi:hypothetical protein
VSRRPKQAARPEPWRGEPCYNNWDCKGQHTKAECASLGQVDNHEIAATLPGPERREVKLLGLEGGQRKLAGDTRMIELSGDHAQALDDVLLYRLPVCARIADRLVRLVKRDHAGDVSLLNLVELLNEAVEIGACRSRSLYCVLTKTALKQHWEAQAPARGIRP